MAFFHFHTLSLSELNSTKNCKCLSINSNLDVDWESVLCGQKNWGKNVLKILQDLSAVKKYSWKKSDKL